MFTQARIAKMIARADAEARARKAAEAARLDRARKAAQGITRIVRSQKSDAAVRRIAAS